MVFTLAFQAREAGSIPVTRSLPPPKPCAKAENNKNLRKEIFILPKKKKPDFKLIPSASKRYASRLEGKASDKLISAHEIFDFRDAACSSYFLGVWCDQWITQISLFIKGQKFPIRRPLYYWNDLGKGGERVLISRQERLIPFCNFINKPKAFGKNVLVELLANNFLISV